MKTLKKMFGISLIIIGLLLTMSGVGLVISPKTKETTENVNGIAETYPVEKIPQVIDNQVINVSCVVLVL